MVAAFSLAAARALGVGHRPTPAAQHRRRSLLCRATSTPPTAPSGAGFVWLVGSGPGSTDYLTLKAARLISEADVVLYDDLGAGEAVELARPGAEKVYVGKRGGDGEGAPLQRSIEEQLVGWCAEGKRVVRLKGGCPSVFGRTASEIAALEDAGCSWELVPGVSSSLAAPLLAGVPLTDKEVGRHFMVTSAHDPSSLDWDSFRAVDTLVLLMGGRSLLKVCSGLLAAGWEGDTPVLVVRAAGTPEQRSFRGTLLTISHETKGEKLSPAVVVVGKVVGLAG